MRVFRPARTRRPWSAGSPAGAGPKRATAPNGSGASSPTCGVRGDAAVRDWAHQLDGLTGPIDVSAAASCGAAGMRRRATSGRPFALAARHLRRVAERQVPTAVHVEVAPGVRIEQRVQPLGARGLLRARAAGIPCRRRC